MSYQETKYRVRIWRDSKIISEEFFTDEITSISHWEACKGVVGPEDLCTIEVRAAGKKRYVPMEPVDV